MASAGRMVSTVMSPLWAASAGSIAEIRPSVSFPTTLFGNDGSIEVGVSFKTTNGLVDTRNYEDHGDLDTFDLGDENGRISFGSAFIGMTIPLN